MNKIWKIYVWLVITVIFASILVISFWLIYPYKTIEFKTPKFKVLTPVVKQGQALHLESDYCKYAPITAVTGREFVNGIIFVVPESTTNRETGCHKIEFAVPIPKELPVGKYFLNNTYSYQVNPVRKIVVKQSSEEFEVVK